MRIRRTDENVEEIEYEIEKNLQETKKTEDKKEECSCNFCGFMTTPL